MFQPVPPKKLSKEEREAAYDMIGKGIDLIMGDITARNNENDLVRIGATVVYIFDNETKRGRVKHLKSSPGGVWQDVEIAPEKKQTDPAAPLEFYERYTETVDRGDVFIFPLVSQNPWYAAERLLAFRKMEEALNEYDDYDYDD